MTNIAQKHRLVSVESPLGEDVLVFGRMTASEELGRLFQFEMELFSERTDIKLAEVLGKSMTVRMELPQELPQWQKINPSRGATRAADSRVELRQELPQELPPVQRSRYFNGFVTRFSFLGMRGPHYGIYRATLSPWLWFLTRTADCRIFQNQKVPEIIRNIFSEHGLTDFKYRLSDDYRQWEYCVQYRETDFDFVSRLMEREGIYYYFIHENGKHTLVLADDCDSHDTFAGYEQVPYFPPDAHDHRERDHLFEWAIHLAHQPGAYALNDFDFKAPRKSLRAVSSMPKDHARSNFEIYDYPGEYTEPDDGNAYARIRLEELLAQHEIMRGRGNAAGLAAGYRFGLTNCPRVDQNREYLIVSAVHELESDAYETGVESAGTGKPYRSQIAAIDARQPYRSPRITPKPVVRGPQTAIVVGKAGEEIWTDQYGRVKVQFHWDREGRKDENSSCWVRVSHPWAGKGWGAVAIPRIGQEVIVDFLEGDPDQPIITGRVYNGANMPPFPLPAGAVVSGIKSNTHKGSGYNEITMDDTAGKEKLNTHAQFDMTTTVEHDQTTTVKNNRSTSVVVNDALSVDANRAVHVKGKLSETIDSGQEVTVSSGYKETIAGGATSTISGGLASTVNGQWESAVNGHLKETVSAGEEQGIAGGKKLMVAGGFTEQVAGERSMTVDGPIKQSASGTIDIHADGAGTYTSGASLKLAVAGSVVEITPGAITISAAGSTIKVDAGGVSISGPKISLNG